MTFKSRQHIDTTCPMLLHHMTHHFLKSGSIIMTDRITTSRFPVQTKAWDMPSPCDSCNSIDQLHVLDGLTQNNKRLQRQIFRQTTEFCLGRRTVSSRRSCCIHRKDNKLIALLLAEILHCMYKIKIVLLKGSCNKQTDQFYIFFHISSLTHFC